MGYKTGGGHVKLYPYEKGGGDRKCLSHAEGGGGRKCFEVALTRKLKVLAIMMWWGRKKFPGGGGQIVLDPRFSHFVASPPPPNP